MINIWAFKETRPRLKTIFMALTKKKQRCKMFVAKEMYVVPFRKARTSKYGQLNV